MPGILPMKMIRVGSSAQSRIAQACDRCRSKKIRCDGVRPTCTQCSNVGFECKTSDKLSRRAFPRGYTESLEDRVRGLEAEVRELKALLDEKDEKIDMLSRIHSFSSQSRKCSASLSPSHAADVKAEVASDREEVLHVEIPAPVHSKATSTGSSTTASFMEAFDQKVQEAGRQTTGVSSSDLQNVIQPTRQGLSTGPKVPPRILSDQFISMSKLCLLSLGSHLQRQIYFSRNGSHSCQCFTGLPSFAYTSNMSPIQTPATGRATSNLWLNCT